jgi:hypothetical protein
VSYYAAVTEGPSRGVAVQAGIVVLEIALNTLVTNEPINRAEGNVEQADLEVKNAAEIRAALSILRASE